MIHFSNNIKSILLASCICLIPLSAWSATPEIVPTFENLGISWTPANRGSGQQAKVQYRVQGSGSWRNAQDLWYDDRGGNYAYEYRGSIVNLNPATTYEVKLTLSPNGETVTALASTWSESFPVGTTVELRPVTNGTYTINQSGSPGAYRLYTYGGSGSAIVDAGRRNDYAVRVTAGVHHVIIRGLTVTGALRHGIFIDTDTHDIIVEDNDISNWGAATDGEYMCGAECDGRCAITSTGSEWPNPGGERLIFQRNTIHNPAGDANSWQYGHPEGAQAVCIRNSPGNNVIRYNTVYSDDDHKYNDIFGYEDNMQGNNGFPGPNSDIYGNRISDSWEDAIEAEGSGENVRIWGNYIDQSFTGVATVTLDQGPMYVWRNVFNTSRELDISDNSDSASGYGRGLVFKVGKANGYGGAKLYIYHNTLLQEEPDAPATKPLGFGSFINNTNNGGYNITAYNNIVHTSFTEYQSNGLHFGDATNSCTNDIDYNLYTGAIINDCSSNRHESSGGIKGTPTYDPSTLFDPAVNEFSQALAVGSRGYDDGMVLPNFNDGYEGAGPDMGAVEHGQTVIIFGINAHSRAKDK